MECENKTIVPPNRGYVPGCEFRIRMAGRLTSFDGVRFNLGHYACWHVIAGGSGFVRCGEQSFPLRRGDMFSIMPDGRVEYYDDPADPWLYYWLHIEGPAALALCHEAGFASGSPWFRPKYPEEVIRKFHSIWKELQGELYWEPVAQAAKVVELLALLKKESTPRRRSPAVIAEQAVAVLDEPGHLKMNVNELAAALHTDRITLYHAFREVLDSTPSDYMIRRRMETAKQLLLENPDWPLWQVASAAGFSNEKYFIRAFKQATGRTPGKFRN